MKRLKGRRRSPWTQDVERLKDNAAAHRQDLAAAQRSVTETDQRTNDPTDQPSDAKSAVS